MDELVHEVLYLIDSDQLDDLQMLFDDGNVTPDVKLDQDCPEQSLLLTAIVKRKQNCFDLLMKYNPDLDIFKRQINYDDTMLDLKDIIKWMGLHELCEEQDTTTSSDIEITSHLVALELVYARQYLPLQFLLQTETFDEIDMQTFLYKTIKHTNCSNTVNILLRHGVNLITYLPHPSPIILAANLDDEKIFKLLIKFGASVEEHHLLDRYFRSRKRSWTCESSDSDEPLLTAVPLSSGSFPNCATPLMCAITHNYQKSICTLIKQNANINYISRSNTYISSDFGNYLHFALILCGDRLSVAVDDDDRACIYNDTNWIINRLVENGCDINYQHPSSKCTPLSRAAYSKQNKIVHHMIKMYTVNDGGNDNIINYHLVDDNDQTVATTIISNCDTEAIRLLLSFDTSLYIDSSAKSPLYAAVCNWCTVDLLIKKGFNPNVPGLLGYALVNSNNNSQTIELLLQSGADPNLPDKFGSHCMDYFIEEFDNQDAINSDYMAQCLLLLLQFGFRIRLSENPRVFLNYTRLEYLQLSTVTRTMLLEVGCLPTNYSSVVDEVLDLEDDTFTYYLMLFGGISQHVKFSSCDDAEKQSGHLYKLCTNAFSLQHCARLALRRTMCKCIGQFGLDRRLSNTIIQCWVRNGYPKSLLQYLLLIQLKPVTYSSGIPHEFHYMYRRNQDVLRKYPDVLQQDISRAYKDYTH